MLETKGIDMSAAEAMLQEQLDRIIARTELRVQQHGMHAGEPGLHGDDAERTRKQREQMLSGLARLKTMVKQIPLVPAQRA
jgi:hypothetical protein